MKAFTMNSSHPPPRNYVSLEQGHALSGKIMSSAVVILFTVVFFIICFHIYSRCVFRRQLLNNRSRGRHPYDYGRSGRTGRTTNFVFTTPYLSNDTNSGGLDAAILKLIPKFIYSSATHNGDLLECAVCLSEFEENEEGRTLPKCNHSFHSECIDMWFHSHSTCPLCRSLVTKPEIPEPGFEVEDVPIQIVIESTQSAEARSSSGVPCSSCKNGGAESCSNSAPGSSSTSSHSSLTIEIQRNGEICKSKLEEKIGGSLAGNQNLKSPGSRISSLKRILSREKIASISALSCVKIDPGIGEAKEELDQVNPVQQAVMFFETQ